MLSAGGGAEEAAKTKFHGVKFNELANSDEKGCLDKL